MMRSMPPKSLFTGIAAVLYAATAFAAIISTTASLPIPGVNAQGNLSAENGGTGTGKIYKDDSTGIVIGVFSGKVINKSGAAATFSNQGVVFEDPWTDERYTATADSERVLRPSRTGFSTATLLVIYNPAANAP